jgi:S1-C subfamily serine protease
LDANALTDSAIKSQSAGSNIFNESVSGTAIIIYNDGNNIGLLTCAHVVNFPDTILTRYDNGKGPIEILSVKIRQKNYIRGLGTGGDVEVVAANGKSDIAFLKKTLDEPHRELNVFDFPAGKTSDLEWGSVVYVMGFPQGNLMVTRAIASKPSGSSKKRFLTDALYNRGISGSPVLAIRDGAPNFELVGMASSASARQVYYVKPGKNMPDYINPEEPYTGNLYMDQYKDVKYGVTFNITIEAILNFLNENRPLLEDSGFNPEGFFK